jgi:hypothetical protein
VLKKSVDLNSAVNTTFWDKIPQKDKVAAVAQ